MDNNHDNLFPYINWDYFYYIGPAVAVGLLLCMLATYCCQQCSNRQRGYEDSYFSSTVFSRRGRNNNAQARRDHLFSSRQRDPFVYHQFIPWNSSRRQNRRNQSGGQYQSAQQNDRAYTGIEHQYYPPATNPLFSGQVPQVKFTYPHTIALLLYSLTREKC